MSLAGFPWFRLGFRPLKGEHVREPKDPTSKFEIGVDATENEHRKGLNPFKKARMVTSFLMKNAASEYRNGIKLLS